MKKLACLLLTVTLVSCGPNPSTESVTKTTTTVTTTTPADPVPPPAPSVLGTLTQANLDRVHEDMSPAQVEAVFGAPTSSRTEPIPIVGGNQTIYNYDSGASSVRIVFKNNLLKEKSGTFAP